MRRVARIARAGTGSVTGSATIATLAPAATQHLVLAGG